MFSEIGFQITMKLSYFPPIFWNIQFCSDLFNTVPSLNLKLEWRVKIWRNGWYLKSFRLGITFVYFCRVIILYRIHLFPLIPLISDNFLRLWQKHVGDFNGRKFLAFSDPITIITARVQEMFKIGALLEHPVQEIRGSKTKWAASQLL